MVIRHARLWKTASAKYQLWYHKCWPEWETGKWTNKTGQIKTSKKSKIDAQSGSKLKQEIDYFIAGTDRDADMEASA